MTDQPFADLRIVYQGGLVNRATVLADLDDYANRIERG